MSQTTITKESLQIIDDRSSVDVSFGTLKTSLSEADIIYSLNDRIYHVTTNMLIAIIRDITHGFNEKLVCVDAIGNVVGEMTDLTRSLFKHALDDTKADNKDQITNTIAKYIL